MRENLNQNNSEYGHFLRSGWLQDIWRHGRKGGGDKFNVNNALICEFHFDPIDINISFWKAKKIFENSTVPSFHENEIKWRSSALKNNPCN